MAICSLLSTASMSAVGQCTTSRPHCRAHSTGHRQLELACRRLSTKTLSMRYLWRARLEGRALSSRGYTMAPLAAPGPPCAPWSCTPASRGPAPILQQTEARAPCSWLESHRGGPGGASDAASTPAGSAKEGSCGIRSKGHPTGGLPAREPGLPLLGPIPSPGLPLRGQGPDPGPLGRPRSDCCCLGCGHRGVPTSLPHGEGRQPQPQSRRRNRPLTAPGRVPPGPQALSRMLQTAGKHGHAPPSHHWERPQGQDALGHASFPAQGGPGGTHRVVGESRQGRGERMGVW